MMAPFRPYAMLPVARRVQTDVKAVVALVLGLMSLVLGPVPGLGAIILGAVARRDIERSDGWLTGRAVAAGGIVAGLFGSGIGIVFGLTVISAFTPDVPEDLPPTTAAMVAAPSPLPVRMPVELDECEHELHER